MSASSPRRTAASTSASRRRRGRSEEHTSELQSHSDLPSFPTRRSSDLVAQPRAAEIPDGRLGTREVPRGDAGEVPRLRAARRRPTAGGTGRSARPCRRLPPEGRPRLRRLRAEGGADRKSTRLNSSHTVIYPPSLHDALPIWSRNRARLKFLMADWGPERFREVMQEKYLGFALPDGDPPPAAPAGQRDHVGVFPQKDGRVYVGFAPKAGQIGRAHV